MKYDYRFGATTLDAFDWYLKSNKPNAFQEFIDNLNRKPHVASEAMARGTAFNEIVDKVGNGSLDLSLLLADGSDVYFVTNIDGVNMSFKFNRALVQKYVDMYRSAISQVFVTAPLETAFGKVELYGYVDKVMAYRADDIKTCKEWKLGKYRHNYQHHVYPYCLNQMGNEITTFFYTPTDFEEMYYEEYPYYEERTVTVLTTVCNNLIRFCEDHRKLITNPKIFGGELIKQK